MSAKVQVLKVPARSAVLNKVPWTFVVIAYMLLVHLFEVGMSGIAGFVFLAICVLVLFAEFFKSGDINAKVFLVDLVAAVAGVIAVTALFSYIILRLEQSPTFYDWFGASVIVGDAVLGPFNSFRTALRNFGVGT